MDEVEGRTVNPPIDVNKLLNIWFLWEECDGMADLINDAAKNIVLEISDKIVTEEDVKKFIAKAEPSDPETLAKGEVSALSREHLTAGFKKMFPKFKLD